MKISLRILRKFFSITLLASILSLNNISTVQACYTTEEQAYIDNSTGDLLLTISKIRELAICFAKKTKKKRSSYAHDLKKIIGELKTLLISLHGETTKTHNSEFKEIIAIAENIISQTHDHLSKVQNILATSSNVISMLASLRPLEPSDTQLAKLESDLIRLLALVTPINTIASEKITEAIKLVQIGRKGPLTVNGTLMNKGTLLACFYAMQ